MWLLISSSLSWTTTTRNSASRRKRWSSPMSTAKAQNRRNQSSTATDPTSPKLKLTKTTQGPSRKRQPSRMYTWRKKGLAPVWRSKIQPECQWLQRPKLPRFRAFYQGNSSRPKYTNRKVIRAQTWSRWVNSARHPSEWEAMATKMGLPSSSSTSKRKSLPKTTKRKSPTPSSHFYFSIVFWIPPKNPTKKILTPWMPSELTKTRTVVRMTPS